jgi:hypothetical protein
MLTVIGLIAYVSLAWNTSRIVSRNRALFEEFRVPTTFSVWAWLYPVPPILLLIPIAGIAFLTFGIGVGVLFYLPGVITARRARVRFETAGTDRVDAVQGAADQVFFAGIVGVMIVAVLSGLFWVSYRPNRVHACLQRPAPLARIDRMREIQSPYTFSVRLDLGVRPA